MIKQIITRFIEILNANGKRSIGAILGLLIGVMILVIGFFKTLFIFICTGLGFYLGGISWNREKIKDWLERILPPGGIG